MKRYVRGTLGPAALLGGCLALAGCGDEQPGRARPVGPGPAETVSDAPASSSPPAADPASRELALANPCELLTGDQGLDLGYDPASARYDDVGVPNTCDYDTMAESFLLMSINLDPEKGVTDLNLTNYQATEAGVGALRALRVTDESLPGICQLSMDLGPGAHVSVMINFAEPVAGACELAERVAVELEPVLPRATS
ncbi:DUF3558 family protein [Actinoalloteichus spitiensis]|uniref:DUF3558 family protein n=1 Tax=Actinoalloteichus spitiensis TaxID=252394 RepID=UPI000363EC2F|nr:DUF3558 family protein [Actinoalloteichus spitiensis]